MKEKIQFHTKLNCQLHAISECAEIYGRYWFIIDSVISAFFCWQCTLMHKIQQRICRQRKQTKKKQERARGRVKAVSWCELISNLIYVVSFSFNQRFIQSYHALMYTTRHVHREVQTLTYTRTNIHSNIYYTGGLVQK